MHVLELARLLRLTDAQRTATEKLLIEHKRGAQKIGAQVVALGAPADAGLQINLSPERRIGELDRNRGCCS